MAKKYAGRPADELSALLLVALEREQLVSSAYRNDTIAARLADLPFEPSMKELLTQAIGWAWKDEQMHAVYTRGLLLKFGSPLIRAQTFAAQISGAIGGWSASVVNHGRFLRAPLSVSLATVVTWSGRVSGKVPRSVRDKLKHLSLAAFCEMQVDAEETAAMGWARAAEVAALLDGTRRAAAPEFARMSRHEAEHRDVFGAIARALDGDAVGKNLTTADVAADVGRAGDFFLPRALRPAELSSHPFGKGGEVHVVAGTERDDKRAELRKIIEAAGLVRVLDDRARATGKALGAMTVLIKPSFMFGYLPAGTCVITDPDLVDALAKWLRERGVGDVVVAEGRNVFDAFVANRGVANVAQLLGYRSENSRLADLSADRVPHEYRRGMAVDAIAREWRDADVRICFAKLRSHPTDLTHLSLGATQNAGAALEDFLFLERQAHRDTALLMPLTDFPPHFSVLEGWDSAADGMVGVIACRKPPTPRRLYAGEDTLAVDIVATRHMDVPDPRTSALIDAACLWFGDPTSAIRVVGCDVPIAGWRGPYHNEWYSLLQLVAFPVWELASGRGAAFVPRMDRAAHPPLHRESLRFRLWRGFVRAIVGMP